MRIRRISSREPNKCPGMDQQKAKTGGGGSKNILRRSKSQWMGGGMGAGEEEEIY